MKVFRIMMGILFLFLFVWLIACWVDVFANNSPVNGSFDYQWWNIFTFFEYV